MNFRSPLIILALLLMLSVDGADKRTADEILDKMSQAMGGDAFRAIKTLRSSGTIEYVGQGINGTMDAFAKAPGKFRCRMAIPDLATMFQGCNGQVCWDVSTLVGSPRELQGEESALLLLHSKTDIFSNTKAYFKKRELSGEARVEGAECYVLKLTPKVNVKPLIYYIDKQSFLLQREVMVHNSPFGSITIQTDFNQYVTTHGVKIPEILTAHVAQMKTKITFTTIEVNKHLPDALFDFPGTLNLKICQCGKTEFTLNDDPTILQRSVLIQHLRRIKSILPDYTIPAITLSSKGDISPKELTATSRWMASLCGDIKVIKPEPKIPLVSDQPSVTGSGNK